MNLDYRTRWGIGGLLALLVVGTHGQHFGTSLYLPPATWAAFFLGGLYLKQSRIFAAGLVLVAALDYAAVTWGGVSDACLSPAYLFMVPAYGVLWLAGRWYARHYQFQWDNLPWLMASLASIFMAETIASGSFYLLSGHLDQVGFSGLVSYLTTWFPQTLQAFAFWMVPAALAHVTAASLGSRSQGRSTAG